MEKLYKLFHLIIKALKYKACAESVRAKLWGPNDFKDKIFINKSGLYCLIFGSKMDKAVAFITWITASEDLICQDSDDIYIFISLT